MRRIAFAVVSTISGLILLFSYHTSTMGGGTTTATNAVAPDPSASSSGQSQTPQDTTSGGGGSGSGGDGTFTGDSVDTRWGPVQVRITVSGGKITDATAVVYPNGNFRDQEINSYALPLLQQSVLQTQSADIDHVSGATVTSDGYVASLQSAIDQAHL